MNQLESELKEAKERIKHLEDLYAWATDKIAELRQQINELKPEVEYSEINLENIDFEDFENFYRF